MDFARYIMAIPLPDKDGLADYLETLAQELRLSADLERKRENETARVRKHRGRVKSARDMLKGYLWQGLDAGRAILTVEQQTGINPDTLHAWAMKDAPAVARDKRNRAIMQKVALGWTNAQLAAHFGLSEKYVARLIARQRRQ